VRYLLDTSVVFAGFRSRNGASHALLRLALTGGIRLVMHYKLVSEYRDALSRPKEDIPGALSYPEIEMVLARLVADADEIEVRYLWRPNLRDESDNFIYEIAVAAAPCTIVTHNVRDFRSGEIRFPDVQIRTPAEVLNQLKQ
jgi:predicted nucleic acid-binding protein